ncbi:hypothetical protein Pst134EA_031743 [Puccinia striiformis f. sp. tritici]|uniref:uncharacterized protein n=1 Tax=Puccinia striiformis f. sp. tritici TaxID=168172 RepID=UPI002008497F|nr:uncharacterized protein Pst134EA_031743 [Puccinia striiformis f. sp. tritici]KAH9442628.1 hypothetical protein Pst134EA_031743 [Puccinia striiformis f. sp. tritici]
MMATEYIPDLFLRLGDFLQDLINKPDPALLPRLRKPSRFEKVTCRSAYQGTLRSHTPNFTQGALYLSEQLDLSENQCDILSQHGMSHEARFTVDKCGQCRDDLLPGAISLIVISKTYLPTH